MSLIYNNQIIKVKNHKLNFYDVCKILNYKSDDENIFLSKEDVIIMLNEEKYEEDKKFVNFLNNYPDPIINIFTFMKNNNLTIFNNNVFKEIWCSIKNKKKILITDNLINFMGFKFDDNYKYKNVKFFKVIKYIKFLKKNNIEYELINYKNDQCKLYSEILKYFKTKSNKIIKKKWVLISIENFKKSIMLLNNENANKIKNYYINLETIFNLYFNYINEQKNKNEIVYICTTKSYAAQNKFKIGGIKNISKLKSRISTYNSITSKNNKWYCINICKVKDFKIFENRFWHIMDSYRDKENKEIVNMVYKDLKCMVECISNI